MKNKIKRHYFVLNQNRPTLRDVVNWARAFTISIEDVKYGRYIEGDFSIPVFYLNSSKGCGKVCHKDEDGDGWCE